MEAQNTHIWLAPLQRKKFTALFCAPTKKPTQKQSSILSLPSPHQPISSNKKLLHAKRAYVSSIPSRDNLK